MDENKTNPEVDDTKKPGDEVNPESNDKKDSKDDGGDKKPPAKSYSQDDLDAAVKKAVAETRAEMEKQAKLAKLPEDEKKQEELRLKEEEYNKKNAELNKRILLQDAKDMLAAEGIPVTFANNVLGADKKETKTNVEAFAKEWKDQMSAQVEEQLKGKNPPKDKKTPPDDPFLSGLGL